MLSIELNYAYYIMEAEFYLVMPAKHKFRAFFIQCIFIYSWRINLKNLCMFFVFLVSVQDWRFSQLVMKIYCPLRCNTVQPIESQPAPEKKMEGYEGPWCSQSVTFQIVTFFLVTSHRGMLCRILSFTAVVVMNIISQNIMPCSLLFSMDCENLKSYIVFLYGQATH